MSLYAAEILCVCTRVSVFSFLFALFFLVALLLPCCGGPPSLFGRVCFLHVLAKKPRYHHDRGTGNLEEDGGRQVEPWAIGR